MGTFVANGQGTTQMLYRRNRYFDPTSGQFTQADPIGIAGGMNAFGFAGGDPVNYNDPFGLTGCRNDDYVCLIARAGWQTLGGLLGVLGGAGGGAVISAPTGELAAVVAVPALAAAGGVIGAERAGDVFDSWYASRSVGSRGGSEQPRFKIPRSGVSGKEAARDVPSWARGQRPRVGEDGKSFARRLLDEKYGPGNWKRGPGEEFNQIQKWGDRGFVEP
jgi:RHS repeat-associated protein